MYLKAAKLAEAMQLAATPNQPKVQSASPEAVSHGGLHLLSVHPSQAGSNPWNSASTLWCVLCILYIRPMLT